MEFHLEDLEVCTAVQRGLYASGWQAGRLSHLEMPVWLFYRFLAARIRGVWPAMIACRSESTYLIFLTCFCLLENPPWSQEAPPESVGPLRGAFRKRGPGSSSPTGEGTDDLLDFCEIDVSRERISKYVERGAGSVWQSRYPGQQRRHPAAGCGFRWRCPRLCSNARFAVNVNGVASGSNMPTHGSLKADAL